MVPDKAVEFATKAHKGQVRKYTGEPYINHPCAVGNLLVTLYPMYTETMFVAAVLHDTVEDTKTTITDIENEFGREVASLVEWLTDISKPEDGNRAARKKIDLQHTSAAPYEAQIIKLADLIDNTGSIIQHDKEFAKTYLQEKRTLLEFMRPEVKETLIFAVAKCLSEQNIGD